MKRSASTVTIPQPFSSAGRAIKRINQELKMNADLVVFERFVRLRINELETRGTA